MVNLKLRPSCGSTFFALVGGLPEPNAAAEGNHSVGPEELVAPLIPTGHYFVS